MPYIVIFGEVHHDHEVYRLGDAIPVMKGKLSDLAELGIVAWQKKASDAPDEGGEST